MLVKRSLIFCRGLMQGISIVTAEKQVTVPFSPCVYSKERHEISKEWYCKYSQLPIILSMQEV